MLTSPLTDWEKRSPRIKFYSTVRVGLELSYVQIHTTQSHSIYSHRSSAPGNRDHNKATSLQTKNWFFWFSLSTKPRRGSSAAAPHTTFTWPGKGRSTNERTNERAREEPRGEEASESSFFVSAKKNGPFTVVHFFSFYNFNSSYSCLGPPFSSHLSQMHFVRYSFSHCETVMLAIKIKEWTSYDSRHSFSFNLPFLSSFLSPQLALGTPQLLSWSLVHLLKSSPEPSWIKALSFSSSSS